MNEEMPDTLQIRRYLLGNIRLESEREQLEIRLLTDDVYFEQLLVEEEELTQDYANGELAPDEREAFEKHFLICDERHRNVTFARLLKRYISDQTGKKKHKSRIIKKEQRNFLSLLARFFLSPMPAVSVIILILSAFVIWNFYLRSSMTEQAIASLNKAYRQQRPLELRITRLNYAPFGNTRGSEAEEKVDVPERNRAEIILLDEAIKDPTAGNLHALGRLYLAKRDFNKALLELEKAEKIAPKDAQILNDLGVAYLENSKSVPDGDGRVFELKTQALQSFDRAIESNFNQLDARFNKAICLQLLNLSDQAEAAWGEYLELDALSPWATEARRYLQQLEARESSSKTPEQILDDFLSAYDRQDEERAWQIASQTKEMNTGIMVAPRLVQNFLEADRKGQTEQRKRFLSALDYLGDLEKKRAGDFYFTELARIYQSASKSERESLRLAQAALRDGYDLYLKSKFSEAETQFARATILFEQSSDFCESKTAEFWVNICKSKRAKIKESNRQLLELADYYRKNNYRWLQVQSLQVLAGNYFDQNEQSKAIQYTELSLRGASEISDTYNQQKALSFQIYIYRTLQNYRQALTKIEQLQKFSDVYFTSQRQKWRNYYITAETLGGLKNFEASVAYGNEALDVVVKTIKSPNIRYDTRQLLSSLYGAAKKYDAALDFVETGLIEMQNSEKEADRFFFTHRYLLQKAHLKRQKGDYQEAVTLYKNVIQIYSEADFAELTVYGYEAHKGLLLCYLATNSKPAIAEELPLVLELFEKNRLQITDEENRNTFFANEQNVYDLAIDYAYSTGDPHLAFEYSEQSKARSLLDSMSGRATVQTRGDKAVVEFSGTEKARRFSELQKSLPERVQVIQYAVLPDKVIIWLVTRTEIITAEKRISLPEVEQSVRTYLKLITENQDAQLEQTRKASENLFNILIDPILPFLDPSKEICFVPDKSLYHLSFSSLLSPATRHYLIEDFAIFFSPSTNVFLTSTKLAQQKTAALGEEKLLGIGNPAFDRREFADLPNLPDAEKEVKGIAAFYPNAKTLIGSAAYKETLLKEVTQSNIFHFAGHYIVNERFPLQSKFPLTRGSENGSGKENYLDGEDILEQKLNSVRLAILSACQTGTEGYHDGEGMFGAARSFLARGVPLLVASQWSVESEATSELMIKFHRYRRQQKFSTVAALRQAQIDMLHDSRRKLNTPYYWAGFLAIGGDANY